MSVYKDQCFNDNSEYDFIRLNHTFVPPVSVSPQTSPPIPPSPSPSPPPPPRDLLSLTRYSLSSLSLGKFAYSLPRCALGLMQISCQGRQGSPHPPHTHQSSAATGRPWSWTSAGIISSIILEIHKQSWRNRQVIKDIGGIFHSIYYDKQNNM